MVTRPAPGQILFVTNTVNRRTPDGREKMNIP
jgi:hypothetical protein